MDRRYALTKAQVAKAMGDNSGNWYWGGIAEHCMDKSTLLISGAQKFTDIASTETPREDR